MDPAVVKKLQDVLSKAMADADHIKRLEDAGLAIKVMIGADYEKYYKDTHEQAKKYTKWAKERPQK